MNKLLGQGCECVVLEYETNKVLKIYRTEENTKIAIENQKKAYEAGIAPQMFSDKPFKYEYNDPVDGKFEFVIISERVRPAVREDFDGWDEDTKEPIDERYAELYDTWDCLFPSTAENDLHIGNLGWMPDGRLVAIDFGALSTSNTVC